MGETRTLTMLASCGPRTRLPASIHTLVVELPTAPRKVWSRDGDLTPFHSQRSISYRNKYVNNMKTIQIKVRQDEDKIFPFVWINASASLGQAEDEYQLEAELIGENASLTIIGVFLGNKNSSVTFNTNVIHKSPKTKSITYIRGVFLDRSTFSNDGMVHITKGAKGADGYFASKILLFDDAKGRSVPSLEIDENDLKAGHASTVGRPDENQMFYLRSRGLTEKDAEKLIVSGFFEPILVMLPKKDQKNIRSRIHKNLNKT